MAGRASRVKMRSRPIDVNKALFIQDTSQREPDEQEIEMALASGPGGGASHGGGGGHGGHGHSGHTGQGDGTVSSVDGTKAIPTPPIHIDLNYHKRFDYGKFNQPSFYIKAHQTAGTGLVNPLDRYDLLLEDMEWLQQYNAAAEAKRPPGPLMSEDDLERMLDLFEKEAGKITTTGMRAEMMTAEEKIVPQDFTVVRAILLAATTIHVRTKIVEPVYDYWRAKRLRLGKALMRQFQEAPPRGNTDPHVAFRLRTEGRRISKRNPRKDDTSGYQKMHYLKRDFVKMIDIIDNVQTREQLKRESALLNIHIFDARLQATGWAQKVLRDHPAVKTAIDAVNAIPPPPSSLAGGLPPPLPPSITSNDDIRMFRLLHSTQPPCSYSRQELDAENRKKKAVRHANAAAAGAAAAAASHASTSHAQKRPSQAVTARPPEQQHRPSKIGHADSASSSSAEHRVRKEARKEARRKAREAAGAEAGVGAVGDRLSTVAEEELDEMEATDEEDFLSENEEDIKFYAQVEAHVKRMRLHGPEHAAANGMVKLEPSSAAAAVPAHPLSYPAASAAYPPSAPRTPIPPGGKVGYVRAVVGRGNLVWLECIVDPNAPPQQQQQQQMQDHAQQRSMHAHSHSQHYSQQASHAAHAHAHSSHPSPPPSSASSSSAFHASRSAVGSAPVGASSVSFARPSVSASPPPPGYAASLSSSPAVPMDISSPPPVAQRNVQPQAIRAQ